MYSHGLVHVGCSKFFLPPHAQLHKWPSVVLKFLFLSSSDMIIFPRSTMDADVVAVSPSSPVSPGNKRCQTLRWPKTWCCCVRWWRRRTYSTACFVCYRLYDEFRFWWSGTALCMPVTASWVNSRSLSLEAAASSSAKVVRKQTSSSSPMVQSLRARNNVNSILVHIIRHLQLLIPFSEQTTSSLKLIWRQTPFLLRASTCTHSDLALSAVCTLCDDTPAPRTESLHIVRAAKTEKWTSMRLTDQITANDWHICI